MALPALDALITEGIESEECGTISSFYNSMRFIGVALRPPVFAALMSNASWLIFILSAFCGIISLFLVLFNVDAKKVKKKKLRDGLTHRLFLLRKIANLGRKLVIKRHQAGSSFLFPIADEQLIRKRLLFPYKSYSCYNYMKECFCEC